MDPQTRIDQFVKLTQDDPNNDMAFFSLGNALLAADRFADAADAFVQCTRINPAMTKGYQLAGRAYLDAGQPDEARPVLLAGYLESTTRGDLLPKKSIAEMLAEINEPIPVVEDKPETTAPAGTGDFLCAKSGQMGTKLPRPPFRNGAGAWIQENISKETFNEWIAMGTKVINELRLDLSNDEHDKVYDYAMRIFLGLDDTTYASVMDGQSAPLPDGQFRTVIDEMMATGGHLESFQGKMHERVD